SYDWGLVKNLHLDWRYETKEIGLPGPKPNLSAIPRYGDSTASSLFDRQSDNFYLIKLSGNWEPSSKLKLQLNTRYTANRTNYLWINQYSLDTSLYLDKYYSKILNEDITAQYYFTTNRKFVIGFDCAQNWFSVVSQYPIDTAWQPTANINGIFSEVSFDISKNLYSLLNWRYDYHSGFGGFFSPAIGLTWRYNNFKFRGHIGRALRAPTLNDLYWPISGNKNIKPEIGNAVQFGIDYNFVNNHLLGMTIFTRNTKNLIAWAPDSLGFWRPSNVDSASISGVELMGKIKIVEGMELQCSGTIQDGYQIRKEQISYDWLTGTSEFCYQKRKQANIPNVTLTAELNVENTYGTKMNILGKYVGPRYNYYPSYDSLPKITTQIKKLPGYANFSLHILQRFSDRLNIKLIVENLYNTYYAEQFGNSFNDYDYPRPGRSVFVGIELKK
ncbi:MAG: TonB-dependent receptor, partial [candidate division WOR-3 bacterium]|nr:TonB-dependent receptor [candidate division WOR-3 bacterium]